MSSEAGAMLSQIPTALETASGRFIDLANPGPADIELDDIAHALALDCRYGGHVRRFYSVAEHSVLVHDLLVWQGVEEELRLAGLFHDAAEAYLGDVVAPLKYALRDGEPSSQYDYLEIIMEGAIARRFGVERDYLGCDALRLADMWALRIEANALTASGGANWRWPGQLPNDGQLPGLVGWIGGLEPDLAKATWIETARSYNLAAETA